jgi:uncharacterized membrane protein
VTNRRPIISFVRSESNDSGYRFSSRLCAGGDLVHWASMSPRKTWLEIDTLRGFAVVFMILNHAGARWLDLGVANGLVSDALVFVGSYAPVLFFFVTGVGHGVSRDPTNQSRRNIDVVYKAALLLLADVFWRRAGFMAVGLDFLGFIGLSMVVLHFTCSGQHANRIAWLILLAAIGIRFGIGPLYRWAGMDVFWIRAAVGNIGVPGFSYWLVPWMAYPALGFLFGDALRVSELRGRNSGDFVPSMLLLGIAAGTVAAFLAWGGFGFSRFGTISVAFFVSAIAVLAFSAALAWLLCASKRFSGAAAILAMRGVSSFAVVPIHIFLIEFIGGWSPLPLAGWVYLSVVFPFIAANYFLARSTDRVAQRLGNRIPVGSAPWCAAGAVLGVTAILVTLVEPSMSGLVLATVAQLIIAVLLTVRPPRLAV